MPGETETKIVNMESFPSGKTCPFPYEEPYPQQIGLMDAVLSSIRDRRKVMILESPTGTGKSLSLACSALTWLRYREKIDLDYPSNTSVIQSIDSDRVLDDDWLNDWVDPEKREHEHNLTITLDRARHSRETLLKEIRLIQSKTRDSLNREKRENFVRSAVITSKFHDRQNKHSIAKKRKLRSDPSVDDFCVTDYHSDHENLECRSDSMDRIKDVNIESSLSSIQLLDGSNLDGSSAVHGKTISVGDVKPGSGMRKIVYAARTHSQLTQFVNELRRTAFEDIRVVALGGRKVLCGNSTINRSGKSEQAVNDACLDLMKDKSSSCPLLVSQEGIATLALHTLAIPSDIEEAAALGVASQTCSYYGARVSLAAAEVVVLPYNLLLSKSSRQAVGLSLKECLVLIDEAHNLPEAIRALHSCQLSLSSAKAALHQLEAYINRYAERLAGRNLYYLGQLRKCLTAFVSHLHKDPQKSIFKSAGEFLMDLKLDNVNLFKITSYLVRSRLAQKVLGFTDSTNKQTQHDIGLSKHTSALSIVQLFISKLTSTAKEGKIITEWPKVDIDSRSEGMTAEPSLRFVALDPAIYFQNVVDEALAIALVGGTLRPFSHVAAELLDSTFLPDATQADRVAESSNHDIFATFSTSILTTFSCDHVVPKSNVLLQYMSRGPSNTIPLDFRHQTRGRHVIIDELGLAIVQIARSVPAGMVIFVPSYSYEAQLVRRWKETGLWNDLNRTKKVHREPKRSSDVEAVLDAYCKDAYRSGAMLLSVVSGKMSEGINFSDDMARCVMVVGLPYPDITDPELKEKMDTMDNAPGGISGRAYYHNLCMRAVNQSVGRAIRHASDYAAIILADPRYSTDNRVQKSLPSWLTRNLDVGSQSFNSILSAVDTFFASRNKISEL